MSIIKLRWQDTLAIRQAVLWPTKHQDFCHVDEDALHFSVTAEQKLVCVASVYIDHDAKNDGDNKNKNNARLRKFATLSSYQKQGFGSFVLNHIIDSLKEKKVDVFWCDARESALEFYRCFGFKTQSERFYKGDIPYFKMQMEID